MQPCEVGGAHSLQTWSWDQRSHLSPSRSVRSTDQPAHSPPRPPRPYCSGPRHWIGERGKVSRVLAADPEGPPSRPSPAQPSCSLLRPANTETTGSRTGLHGAGPGAGGLLRPPRCASPQVQNVHGAFNALGGADRLTSNRTCPPPALGPQQLGGRGRAAPSSGRPGGRWHYPSHREGESDLLLGKCGSPRRTVNGVHASHCGVTAVLTAMQLSLVELVTRVPQGVTAEPEFIPDHVAPWEPVCGQLSQVWPPGPPPPPPLPA